MALFWLQSLFFVRSAVAVRVRETQMLRLRRQDETGTRQKAILLQLVLLSQTQQ